MNKPIILFAILAILIIYTGANVVRNLIPTVTVLCESRAKSIGMKITNETIKEYMNNLEYDSLMNLTYDNLGKLSTMNANIIRINTLSAQLASAIQEKLYKVENSEINLPLGRLLGWSIFSGYGPSVKIKLIPVGNVSVSFKTEFTSQGINQTKHTIYIETKTMVKTVAPFISNTITSDSLITVAETIIVGDIPDAYYSITGIEDLQKMDSLEIIN